MSDTPVLDPEDFLDGCELDFGLTLDDELELLTIFSGVEAEETFSHAEKIRSLFAAGAPLTIYQTGLAAFLRAEGLTVIEINGWQTRGSSSFTPHGSVNHHTANPSGGWAPSLNMCINGRSDLPGPLCNVLQSRQPDHNGLDIVYLIAAGRANHAGTGGWAGNIGNSSVWGLEVEHAGTNAEPFPLGRYFSSLKVHAAFARYSQFSSANVCQHYEWAPTRKIDFARAYIPDGNRFRADVGNVLAPPPPPQPQHEFQEEDVRSKMVSFTLDAGGNGWSKWDPGFNRAPLNPQATLQGPYPPSDGYWYADRQPEPATQVRGNEIIVSVSGGRPGGTVSVWLQAA